MTEKKPAEGLTRLRQEHKWSLKTLAELIGVTPATVWQWERDEGKIKAKQLKQLQSAFTDEELHEAFPEKIQPARPSPDPSPIDHWVGTTIPIEPPDELRRLMLLDTIVQIMAKMSVEQLQFMLNAARAYAIENNIDQR